MTIELFLHHLQMEENSQEKSSQMGIAFEILSSVRAEDSMIVLS